MSKTRRNAIIRWSLLILLAVLGAGGIYLNAGGSLSELGIGGGAASGTGGSAEAGSAVADDAAIRTPVRVITPEQGTLERSFTVSGYLESDQVVTVTPKVQGTLEELNVDLGDTVEKGRLIGRIDDARYRLELQRAQANYAAAQSTFQRTQDLYESDATSGQSLDQARSQFQAAEAQLELAQLQLDYSSLNAPISGTVIRRHTAAGSVVGSNSAIVTIADLTDMVVQAKIPEQHFADFDREPAEIPVRISLPALPDGNVGGTVRTVSPYISPSSRNFDVVVDFQESGVSLRPGMFVEVTFVLARRRDTYSLPFASLSDDGKLWYLRGDGTVTAVTPELGFSSQERFAVSRDWAQRRVVVEGQNFLTEGQSVTLVEERRDS